MSDKWTITRKELYDLVWLTPISILSKEFKISEFQLRGICAKFNIPVPKSGFWMKIQYNKPVFVEPFVENCDGISSQISFIEAQKLNAIHSETISPIQTLQHEIENNVKVNLKVPLNLINPEREIREVEIALSKEPGYELGIRLLRANNKLNITVTKSNIGRAIRFMDTLIKAFKVRGHQFIIDGRGTFVVISREKIKINCRELERRVLSKDTTFSSYEKKATGILSFNTESSNPKQWKDGKLKLEDQLSNIIAKLEIEGKQKYEERITIEKRWEEQRFQNNIQLEKDKQIQDELDRFKVLLQDSKRYDETAMMRSYINAIKKKQNLLGPNSDLKLSDWIEWAEKKVNWYDPLINSPDSVFDSVDKKTLELKGRK